MKNNLIRSLAIGAVLLGTGNALAITTDDTPTAEDLVSIMLGSGITADNVILTCAGGASGVFGDGEAAVGIAKGIIVSSGNIANVIGPNNNDGISASPGTPGDADLETLIGEKTNDACVLEFDFQVDSAPGLISASVAFNYVFASDEYNEYVDQFNDVFAFFVNGENIALITIPGTTIPVSIDTVNQTDNSEFYINNDDCQSNPASCPVPDTQMDGLTTVLSTAEVEIVPGQSYHLKLAVADALDTDLDSNVFIQASSLKIVSNLPPVAQCQDATIVLDSNGEAVLTPEQVNDGSYDPDPNDSITLSVDPEQFTCSDIGDHTVTLTVTDGQLDDTCEATVTVEDVVDSDGDGVTNCYDLCPDRLPTDIDIDDNGCGLAQRECPCDAADSSTHDEYVRCITRLARANFSGNKSRQARKDFIISHSDTECGLGTFAP